MNEIITNEAFLDAMTREDISNEMFSQLNLKQQSLLSKYNKKLYDKLNEKNTALSDEAFLDITSNTENIDIEKFYNMSDKQKQIFKRMDIATYEKMSKIYDALTVEDFNKLDLNEQSLLYKINPDKYNQLLAEQQEVQGKLKDTLGNTAKYYNMIKSKGLEDNYLQAVTELTKKPIVQKYPVKFESALKNVLSLDHYTLRTMTKEAFREKIELQFKNSLPLSEWKIG